jgi:two-component system, NarL family, invasion response regulator UvrY
MSAIRLILADDHTIVRRGFRMLLEEEPAFTIVAEADSGESLYQLLSTTSADIVVLDLMMPGMGGMEALNRVSARYPDVKVLVLSAYDDLSHARRALQAGAKGYLTKRSAAETLVLALTEIAAGRPYIEPELAQRLASVHTAGAADVVSTLSPREFEVFLKLAHGTTVNAIAIQLNLSPRTVGTHLYNVKQKLGAETSADLTLIALNHGLLKQ